MNSWTQTYRAIFAPWNRLIVDAPAVIAIRLLQLPWLTLTDTSAGQRENMRMVSEKVEAMQEFQQAVMMAPMRFWSDFMLEATPGRYSSVADRTLKRSSARLAKPYASRVASNRRRLSQKR